MTAEGSRPLELLGRVAEAAGERGVAVNALGGVGVSLRAGPLPAGLQREHGDLDVVIRRAERHGAEEALAAAGLVPDEMFNRRNGHQRQIWWTADGEQHVDVFLGQFRMCHELDLDARVDAGHRALPASDLLLTKLQIVEINAKDVRDAAALLSRVEIGDEDEPGAISLRRLSDVLGADWGFYTTFADNLERLPAEVADIAPDAAPAVSESAGTIAAAIEGAPKSRGWRMRARVGRRKRWYALPDESLDEPRPA